MNDFWQIYFYLNAETVDRLEMKHKNCIYRNGCVGNEEKCECIGNQNEHTSFHYANTHTIVIMSTYINKVIGELAPIINATKYISLTFIYMKKYSLNF